MKLHSSIWHKTTFKSTQRRGRVCFLHHGMCHYNPVENSSLLKISAKNDCVKGQAILVCPHFMHGDKEVKFTHSAWLVHDDFSELLDEGQLSTSYKIHMLLVYYGNLHGVI